MGHALAPLTVLAWTPREALEACARTGYADLGLRFTPATPNGVHWPLMDDAALRRETVAAMRATGVGLLDVELVRLDPSFRLEVYRGFIETAAEVGARRIITQGHDPERRRLVDHFAQVCELAEPLGLTVELEFLSWDEVCGLRAAAEVVAAVGRPNAGLLIDALHFFRTGSDLAQLASLPRDWFRFMQTCDALAEAPDTRDARIAEARGGRLAPGEGGLDLVGLMAALPPLTISVECPNTVRATEMGLEPWIAHCLAATKALEA